MQFYATLIAVVAGACLGIGVVALFVAARQPRNRLRNLLFGMFALAYAGAILSARAAFLALTAAEYATAFRSATVFASIGFSLLIWYVAVYTGIGSRPLLWALTGGFAVIGISVIAIPELFVASDASLRVIELPWGETLRMGQETDPPMTTPWAFAQLLVVGYITYANVAMFRRGARREAIVLAFGLVWLVFTLVEEAVVVLGGFDFVYLSDLGFLGFVIAISLSITNDAIEANAQLREYRSNLEAMVRERTLELETAHAQLLAHAEEQAAEAERSRLARELHDAVTQLLFSINLIAGSLPRQWRVDPEAAERSTDELRRLTRGALAQMRVLLRELRPHAIIETDLGTLVTQLSDGVGARYDIPTEIHAEMRRSLPEDVHFAFYRIAQEAVNNVAKHADASHLMIDLTGDQAAVRLAIVDDGVGFDATEADNGNLGLRIMSERAETIGADLAVVSVLNAGTSVTVSWTPPSESPDR